MRLYNRILAVFGLLALLGLIWLAPPWDVPLEPRHRVPTPTWRVVRDYACTPDGCAYNEHTQQFEYRDSMGFEYTWSFGR